MILDVEREDLSSCSSGEMDGFDEFPNDGNSLDQIYDLVVELQDCEGLVDGQTLVRSALRRGMDPEVAMEALYTWTDLAVMSFEGDSIRLVKRCSQ